MRSYKAELGILKSHVMYFICKATTNILELGGGGDGKRFFLYYVSLPCTFLLIILSLFSGSQLLDTFLRYQFRLALKAFVVRELACHYVLHIHRYLVEMKRESI